MNAGRTRPPTRASGANTPRVESPPDDRVEGLANGTTTLGRVLKAFDRAAWHASVLVDRPVGKGELKATGYPIVLDVR